MALHFYDSASPRNIPSGVHAAIYINGFAWPHSEIMRMSGIIRISVLREASWARFARVLDVESGAALVEDVVPFIKSRREHGFNDATVYVNRSNWDQVRQAVEDASIPHPRYWVSTLDGTMRVADEWATQYSGGIHAPYDVSILHGVDDFHRPS